MPDAKGIIYCNVHQAFLLKFKSHKPKVHAVFSVQISERDKGVHVIEERKKYSALLPSDRELL